MGQSPFAKRGLSSQAASNRRRSTRIDYETPVVLTGRDASGQTFREETGTVIVNFHGAKVRTANKVLVGMLVTVESVRTGQTRKAVCVNTYEPSPEHPYAAIALQLIQPGNIWGVENTPLDWAAVAAELGGRTMRAEPARTPAIPFKPVSSPSATNAAALAGRAAADAHLADLEQRAAKVIETLIEKLRVEANAAVGDALSTYEQRLATLVVGAEARISQRVEQAAAEVAATIETLRSDAIAEMVQETLQEFQRRLGEMATEHEGQLSQRAAAEVAATIETLRSDAIAETVQETLQEFQRRLGEMATEHEGQLSQRAAAEVAATIETLRSGAIAEMVQETLQEFQRRLGEMATEHEGQLSHRAATLVTDAEGRITKSASISTTQVNSLQVTLEKRLSDLAREADRQFEARVNKAFAEYEAALVALRSDLEDELGARRERAVQEVEQALRSRVTAMLSTLMGPSAGGAQAPMDAAIKK